jgi:hypothetical protein
MSKTIGTILHGALGDCYEQLCAIKQIRKKQKDTKWTGFFKDARQKLIMSHYSLDMLDEVYTAEEILSKNIDNIYQFQVKDMELQNDIINKLPGNIKSKFNLKTNIKPWQFIREHDFGKGDYSLELSDFGREFLPICMKLNGITEDTFKNKITIGYLWRYRSNPEKDAIKPYFQQSEEDILKSKSELFNALIKEFDAHIIIAGMRRNTREGETLEVLKKYGYETGSYRDKFTERGLDIPDDKCTYLKGLGFAAEAEIMSKCDLLIMMPSGFSEVLWMMRKNPVLLIDSPPVYLLKLLYNRMPLFNNLSLKYFIYNNLTKHTTENVLKFIKSHKLIKKDEL